MKGLLIKDLRILLTQKRFFLIIFGFGVMFLFSNDTPESAMGYVTILSSMLVLTTMSYDEFEKGMSFIMALPITKATYVWEKYLLGVILEVVMSIFTTLCAILVFQIRGILYPMDLFLHSELLFIGISFLFLAVMIPVQLKFGSENGKYVKMVAIFVAAAVAVGVVKLLSIMGIDVMGVLETLLNTSILLGFGVIMAFCVTLYLVSAVISLQIMKKKEF